ncbi:MAG: hypothetical protein OEZ65_00570 [Gemmatimonadota bacterium]|nr:hypothetical protein [Gemmatimonadota bacterium]MDH5758047.1 hypothetical protein [Gemmatimonadota bacterium]
MQGRHTFASILSAVATALVVASCVDDSALTVKTPGGDPDLPDTAWYGVDSTALVPDLPAMSVGTPQSPLRMTTAPGAILVTDSRMYAVLQLDPETMRYSRGFRVRGKPLAIGYYDRWILVGNASRQTIEVYDGQGGSLRSNFGLGAVKHPSDLAVDPSAQLIFVVDGGDKNVKVFARSGILVRSIEGLDNPIGVAVDPVRQEILVSDYGTMGPDNHASVKIFGYDGAFRAEISGAGSCGGSGGCTDGFSRPQGLLVGPGDLIYLADAILAKVLVYNRTDLAKVGEIGDESFLRLPTDVAIGRGGDLFIVSNRTQQVRVVRKGATP